MRVVVSQSRRRVDALGARAGGAGPVDDGAAASLGPSVPSVPAARMTAPSAPSHLERRSECELLAPPALALSRTVTVVSPPAITQAGGASWPLAVPDGPRHRDEALRDFPRLALQCSREYVRREAEARAFAAAASTTSVLFPITMFLTRAKTGSPALGVSGISPALPARAEGSPRARGAAQPESVENASASSYVEVSAVVGPRR